MRIVPEQMDPRAQARALAALRLRLDATGAWLAARCWPAIARTVGYASGDAAKQAAWRTFNRLAHKPVDWFAAHAFVLVAEAMQRPPHARELRQALRDARGHRLCIHCQQAEPAGEPETNNVAPTMKGSTPDER